MRDIKALGHWISKCCAAHCGPKDRECWNCGRPRNRTSQARLTNETCDICGLQYHGLTDGNETIAMCPFDFDHRGWNAYYPPNFRPDLLWDLNGYEFHENNGRRWVQLKSA